MNLRLIQAMKFVLMLGVVIFTVVNIYMFKYRYEPSRLEKLKFWAPDSANAAEDDINLEELKKIEQMLTKRK